MPTPAQLRALVLAEASRLGFDLAGVAAARDYPELRRFADWIADGRAGDMHYLERRSDADGAYAREDVRNVFPWARSVVCCAQIYNAPYPRSTECESDQRGWISRYAWGDDYHERLLEKMRALAGALATFGADHGASFKTYVDTGPLVERVYAKAAGLGWMAKNTCLIHEQLGSYFFLASLVSSLEIEADSPVDDRCGSCTRCVDACPTGALDGDYQMDASRCIAYLNIELRGGIPEALRPAIGMNVFGCDICQDVCPWNSHAPASAAIEFQPRGGLFHPPLAELAALTEAGYRARFAHSAIKRARYPGLLRNVALAMGNSGNEEFIPELKRLAQHADETVQEQARWSLGRLMGRSCSTPGRGV